MQKIRRARFLLLAAGSILLAIGVVMIYSASAIYAHERFGDSAFFLKRHLLYLFLGVFLFTFAARINTQKLRRYAFWILAAVLASLFLVFIPPLGYSAGGASRWFKVLGFTIQPSEFLKLALVFYMADYLDRKKKSLHDFKKTVLPALLVLGAGIGLVLAQPDLGTAITLGLVMMLLFFAAGVRLQHLGGMLLAALPFLCYALLSKPYRRKRLLAFFNPWEDPRGVGFQIVQSFLALGAGGLFGVGIGKSQQKLFYLPESHTDFIFSIIGEELGFLGASSVVILYGVIIFSGMMIVLRLEERFSQLLGLGIVALIGLQAIINIGVSIGALPTKGLSLPFVSYGGSALWASMLALGLLVNLCDRLIKRKAAGRS